MSELTIIDWNYKLQYSLDQMTSDELNVFMKDKAIRYEGKLYTTGEVENAKGKNSKTNRKTSANSKSRGGKPKSTTKDCH